MTHDDKQVEINSLPIFSQNKPIKYVVKVSYIILYFKCLK
jgi:hypothetical protein